jgi:hypothetical protein
VVHKLKRLNHPSFGHALIRPVFQHVVPDMVVPVDSRKAPTFNLFTRISFKT